MIKIVVPNAEDILELHFTFINENYLSNLDNHMNDPNLTIQQVRFLKLIKRIKYLLICGTPDILSRIIVILENKLDLMGEQDQSYLRELLKVIFDYDSFSGEELLDYGTLVLNLFKKIKSYLSSITLDVIKNRYGIVGKLDQLENIKSCILNQLDSFLSVNKFLDNFIRNKVHQIRYKIEQTNYSTLKELKSSVKGFLDEIRNVILMKRREKLFDIKESWGPYQLVLNLNVSVCPYCNRQYISTLHTKSGKTRADLDHFSPKSKYPYLALSFYNLIPSCKVCNSSFKLNKDFTYIDNLNPYENGFEGKYLFTIKAKEKEIKKIQDSRESLFNFENIPKEYDLSFLFGDSTNFEISLKPSLDAENQFIKKAKGNREVFKIKELYAFHKNYIQELIKKAIIYNETRINQLFEEYEGKLFSSKEEVLQLVLGNVIKDEDLSKQPFSKLIKDIAQELGIIK
ncbi:UNVERIFIED_ORG: Ni,Fe-hydrogenase maturation factor [Peribacillus simplex]